jgi:hypothetical protein
MERWPPLSSVCRSNLVGTSLMLTLSLAASGVVGQTDLAAATFKEPNTGIVFSKQLTPGTAGGLEFGIALPANAETVTSDEYIGYFVSARIMHSVIALTHRSHRLVHLPVVKDGLVSRTPAP